jgi:hypothetical protein
MAGSSRSSTPNRAASSDPPSHPARFDATLPHIPQQCHWAHGGKTQIPRSEFTIEELHRLHFGKARHLPKIVQGSSCSCSKLVKDSICS